jgi:hypothetical protein
MATYEVERKEPVIHLFLSPAECRRLLQLATDTALKLPGGLPYSDKDLLNTLEHAQEAAGST